MQMPSSGEIHRSFIENSLLLEGTNRATWSKPVEQVCRSQAGGIAPADLAQALNPLVAAMIR